MLKRILIIIYILRCLTIYSQDFFQENDPRILNIDRLNGIQSLSISGIVQDKDGIIWMGSQGALHRFDGLNMTVYSSDPFDENTLPNDLVQTLSYDKKRHRLIIGTYNGISIFDIESKTFTNFSADKDKEISLSNNIVIAVQVDNQDNIWVGTMDGLNLINKDLTKITKLPTIHHTIRTLYLDSENRMWVGGYDGIDIYNTKTLLSTTLDVKLPSNLVMKIIGSGKDSVLIGMWDGGVVEYSITTGIINNYTLPDNNVYSLAKTSDDTIWAGSWGGGIWSKSKNGDERVIKDELANGVIYSLFEDRSGLLWIGTNGGGAHIISPRKRNYSYITSSNKNEGWLPKGKISEIYRDSNNNLWIAVYGTGLFLYNEVDKVAQSYPMIGSNINHMTTDSQGRIWVSTDTGLATLDMQNRSYTSWDDLYPDLKLSHNIITHVLEDSEGKFWISTYGEGINIVDLQNNTILNMKYSETDNKTISDNIVYHILEMKDGTKWLSTNSGLSRYDKDKENFTRFRKIPGNRESLSGNITRTLFEDSSGNLWIGTYSSGLNVYNDKTGTFKSYSTKDGLSSNNVLTISEDNDKNIWVSTRSGLNVLTPKNGKIKSLTEEDGLFSIFFNSGFFKEKNGDLLFGGANGVTKISNFKRFPNKSPPRILLTEFSVLHEIKDIKDKDTISLNYNENYISFGFIGIDYESPTKITYKYKLEGLNNSWIDSGTRNFAEYTSLKPGKYQFSVKSINSNGIESLETIDISIIINKPWFKTWIAYIIYIVLIIGVIYLLIRLKYSMILGEKNRELKILNKRLEMLSIKDSLTGTYNRFYFDKTYLKEFNRAHRQSIPIAVIFIDIDDFKEVNDKYGHAIGDTVIRSISDVLTNAIKRDSDFISRYGGDEFIAFLYNVDKNGIEAVTNNIIRSVHNVQIERTKINPSVSIGVSIQTPDSIITANSIIENADKALYKAKSRGKDRVVFFKEE
ncbi:MAG: diguanylate cyclase [Spirochaetaceae bacterium]